MEELRLRDGARGLTALLTRAVHLDPQALVRLQRVGDGFTDAFVTTPFDCLAARRVVGEPARDGAVVSAADLLAALRPDAVDPAGTETLAVGPARDAMWPGALPPAHGFTERDTVPVAVARQLANAGRDLARQFSGPAGPPKSLLDSIVLTADADAATPVEIPMRMIFTCTSLGLIPGFAAPDDIPRHLRVATAGRWVRLDAPFGSVYRADGLGLLF